VERGARTHRPSLRKVGDSRGDATTDVHVVGPNHTGACQDLIGAAHTVTADHGYN
jgi:hypothetical protein